MKPRAFKNITTRRIAKQAGVNSAAIHEKLLAGCPVVQLHERLRLSLVQLQTALLMTGFAPEAYRPFVGDRLDTQAGLGGTAPFAKQDPGPTRLDD